MKKLLLTLFIGAAVTVSAQNQFQNEAVGMITYTKGKIDQLADAMPEDKMSWSASDNVRSFSSVIGHVTSANYFFGMKLGATLPEGINPMTIEKEVAGKSKSEVVKALNKSHEFVIGAIKNLKESEMGDAVEMPFPGDFTKMSIVNIVLSHTSEHMGQLIAYARSNGVAPPWSVAQGGE